MRKRKLREGREFRSDAMAERPETRAHSFPFSARFSSHSLSSQDPVTTSDQEEEQCFKWNYIQ